MVSTLTLLEFVTDTDRELFFDAPFEVKVMAPTDSDDDQEREYQLLAGTDYSLSEVIGEANGEQPGPLTKGEVSIPDSTAKKYLELMEAGAIDDRIHDHPAAGRELIVSLADVGYVEPADFVSESVDHIDIAKEAGVDRDRLGSIATEFVGGFSTGSDLRDGEGPFATVTIADSFDGWTLQPHQPEDTVITWVSNGRFNVTVKASEGQYSVVVNTPDGEKHNYYRKGRMVLLDAAQTSAADAIQTAQDWLREHQIPAVEDTGLADEPHIGPSTHDYLLLEFGVASRADLEQFISDSPEEAAELFGDDAFSELSSE